MSTELEITRVRHELKRRTLTVAAIEELTPHVRRLRLAGADLADLQTDGFDDHVKVFIPEPGQREPRLPAASGPGGRPDFGDGPRPTMRDYTPRRLDRQACTLDIDFVLHGDGPAARWAAQVQVGDPVFIGGPRGSMVVPSDLQWQWLIGDESALAAIGRRLDELGDEVQVAVVVETEDDGPLPPLKLGPRRTLVRVRRPAAGTPEELAAPLVAAVRALPTPQGRGHAFAAAESRTVRAVREVLVGPHGLHKSQVRASAYWQRGAVAHHENIED
jgi:NADPH-dependent ferric siderophore reductase